MASCMVSELIGYGTRLQSSLSASVLEGMGAIGSLWESKIQNHWGFSVFRSDKKGKRV